MKKKQICIWSGFGNIVDSFEIGTTAQLQIISHLFQI
jgi:hypothetical protein